MSDLVAALGLVLVIEGILYAAFPATVRRMLKLVEETPDTTLRQAGLAAAVIGLVIVSAVRG